jgi:hypothetical protein
MYDAGMKAIVVIERTARKQRRGKPGEQPRQYIQEPAPEYVMRYAM